MKSLLAKVKERKNIAGKKHKGFDAVIATVALILFVVIIVALFRTIVIPKLQTSIEKTGNEIEAISSWE